MPERVYSNRVPGQERIHIELTPQEISRIMGDLAARPDAASETVALLRIFEDILYAFGVPAPVIPLPGSPRAGGALTHNPGAGALRAAAFSCHDHDDCAHGLTEDTCAIAHPIQITGWTDDVVSNVRGPVDAIAAAVLHGALPPSCSATAEDAVYGPLGPCVHDRGHDGPVHLGPDGHRFMRGEPAPRRGRGIVHRCPPDGSGITPCCGLTPFQLPRTDQLTETPAEVTCAGHVETLCASTVDDAHGSVHCGLPYRHETHRRGFLCWDDDKQWYARLATPTTPARDTGEPT